MKNDREYRNMPFEIRQDGDKPSFLVEGYASTFEAYKLIEIDGEDYNERIEPTAFDDADMSDVVFRVDHEGPVYARASAGTVKLDIDEHGLHQVSDLSQTQRARDLFEDIAAGNYPQMSFAFIVDDDEYDSRSHTRIIRHLKKIFDVSAVSFPANPGTDISPATRSRFDGFIEAEKAERLERQKQLELEKAKYEYFRRI